MKDLTQRIREFGPTTVQSAMDADSCSMAAKVAVNLWGLDAIKTKGESVAIVLYLVGARPVREGVPPLPSVWQRNRWS